MAGIGRFIPICGGLLGSNSTAGLDSVANTVWPIYMQRLGLERFHCNYYRDYIHA